MPCRVNHFIIELLPREVDQTHNINHNDSNGNDVAEDGLHPLLNLQTLTAIGFGNEVVPAPTELVAAEQCKHQRAERQQIIGNNKVPEIKPCTAGSERLESKYTVAERGGSGGKQDADTTYNAALRTAPTG